MNKRQRRRGERITMKAMAGIAVPRVVPYNVKP